jgi:hypothetical protein
MSMKTHFIKIQEIPGLRFRRYSSDSSLRVRSTKAIYTSRIISSVIKVSLYPSSMGEDKGSKEGVENGPGVALAFVYA